MKLTAPILTLAAAAMISSCGKQDDGYVYKSDPVQYRVAPESRGSFDLTEATYRSMTWIHQCPDSPIQVPVQRPGHLVLEGNGPHSIYRERLLNTDVIFKGKLCAPRHYSRDIVIGIDVSTSAYLLDKPANGSCKRLEAMQAILNTAPADTSIGLFTFGEEVIRSTNGLAASRDAAIGQLTADGTDLLTAVCGATDTGGTDFSLGMAKAKEQLETGRANGTKKELYLISEGQQISDRPLDPALQIARELATQGVVINGETLKVAIAGAFIPSPRTFNNVLTTIATSDVANQKLIKPVAQASVLAADTAKFAINEWAEARLAHGTTGAQPSGNHNLKALFTGDYEFTIPTFRFDLDLVQTGHTVKIDIKDTHGLTKTQEIKFVWID